MRNQVPTLFIGIGGIGCQIAGTISDMIDEETRKHVGFIGIDTNGGDIKNRESENHKMFLIQTSEKWKVETFLDNYPENKEWFPTEKILRKRKMLAGAGQIRALSRLTFIAAEKKGKFEPIFDEIKRIRQVGVATGDRVVVVIVGSITGGTGAGMFIELPFLIRKNIGEICGVKDCTIRGMFVGSDITETVQNKDVLKSNVRVNGYTCLKELNALYIHHIDNKDLPDVANNGIRLENYDHTNTSHENVPYDYLYLFESNGDAGTIGKTGLANIIKYISHIAYNLLFTPVLENAISIEDNFILDSIKNRMLDRYVGAGVCRLIFPVETAQNYVTYSLVNEQIESDWLVLDRRYASQNKSAMKRRNRDRNVTVPNLPEVYVAEFRKESIGSDDASNNLFAKFASEAWTYIDNEPVSYSELFVSKLEERINSLVETEQVKSALDACKINEKNMKKFKNAEREIVDFSSSLEKLVKLVKRLKNDVPTTYAEEIFPLDVQAMLEQKDNDLCIYGLLAPVHPIVARFFIYDLINRLKEINKEASDILSKNNLTKYKNEDFNPKTADKQEDAQEVLDDISRRYNKLWGKLGFLSDMVYSEKDAMKKLSDALESASKKYRASAKEYLLNGVTYALTSILLDRLNELADLYEKFFMTIEENINTNNVRLKNYEDFVLPFGSLGVYCNKKAYKRMTEEFVVKKGDALVLSDTTKKAVFEKLFAIQADNDSKIAEGIIELTEEQDRRLNEKREALDAVFRDAVVSTIHSFVIQNGEGIVCLSIKEALDKEYKLAALPDTSLKEFITDKAKKAMVISSPMLATTDNRPNEDLVFVSLSKENTVAIDGVSDVVSTIDYFFGADNGVVGFDGPINLIVNDELSKSEIDFVRISYGHVIEQLEKYAPGSINETEYTERLAAIANGIITHPEFEVNPHLNRYWHEEGYIPAMQSSQREQDKKDLVKTFILGLAFDCFIKLPFGDELARNRRRVSKWAFYVENSIPIFIEKDDKLINNDFIDLYNSILFNGAIKRAILEYVDEQLESIKGYNSAEVLEKTILKEEFIEDLIQSNPKARKGAELNIFDVFLKMYSYMKRLEWNNLVIGLRDVLWEIFEKLFEGNEQVINKMTRKVLKAIYQSSSLPSVKSPTEREEMLNRMYNKMLKDKYVAKKEE